jgi:Lipopolysaccharide kinase (Kdo/WaaP) family
MAGRTLLPTRHEQGVTQPRPADPGAAVSFVLAEYRGEVAAGFRPVDLEREARRVADPAAALKTLHWGRNYLYVTRCETLDGPVDVAVKQFRSPGLRDRLRRRRPAGKAAWSWRVARSMLAAGLATPEPLMLLEPAGGTGASFYVCRYLGDALEARYLLRAANAGRQGDLFPEVDFARFLAELGRMLARLHAAGFWHRDLSIGNVLLAGQAPAGGPVRAPACGVPYELYLVDLNRTRMGRPPGLSQRARDLSRLAILRPEHQDLFLGSYWTAVRGEAGPPPRLARLLYALYHRAFLWKNQAKQRLRRGRQARVALAGRVPHAHIPGPPAEAPPREKSVWDRLSDQPHQHAGRIDKLRVRLADARIHAALLATAAAAAPRVLRRYRELRRGLYGAPVAWQGAGVCLRPWPEAPAALLGLVEELGTRHLLLRLHPWEERPAAEEELARELHQRGYELTFALPQNRELVRDPARWRAAVERIAERFSPYGGRFQVGQAINRSKWGIWNMGEYVELARAAEAILRRQPGVELLGPAVIDFEYHVTAAVLNLRRAGFRFDAVSSLLYVDRRGAPESRQAGFDTVDKVLLLKAIAETARNAAGRCWITEVNWPLWEGPHAPAGRAVAVDEETQADYLVRYYLLTLGTGLIERVFWWQLAARGYGLVDPAERSRPRCRPSFHALRVLVAQLAGARFQGPLPTPGSLRLYLFRRPDGSDLVVGWSHGGTGALTAGSAGTAATLPRPAARVFGRDGAPLPTPPGATVHLTPSPAYFHLVPE